MSRFSQLAETLIGSEIVRLGNMINERVRAGEEIFNYTIGDFDPEIFPIPAGLRDDIQAAYQSDFTNYPSAEGILPLREAISGFVEKYHGVSYAVNEIQVASGGRPLIYSLFKVLVDPGDKVVYAVPSWNNNHYVHMNGGVHCVIEAKPESAFMPTADDIRPHLQDAVLLCLCTPQNPTGTTFTRSALAGICDAVLEENARRPEGARKLYVMFDQMYGLLPYGQVEHYNPVALRPAMKDYTVFADGISKSFAATGVRVGWSMGPAPLIAKMKALLTHIGAWAPMAEQQATASFLERGEEVDDYLLVFRDELEYRLDCIYQGITKLKEKGYPVDAIPPQAAIYLTIKFDLAGSAGPNGPLANQEDVTGYLLSEARLAVVPFYAFGADKSSPWYRLSVGTTDKARISRMLAQLEAALEQLEPVRS